MCSFLSAFFHFDVMSRSTYILIKLFILSLLFTQLSECSTIYWHLLLLMVVSSCWQLSVKLLGTFLFMSSGKHKHLFLFHVMVRVKLLDCNVCVCVLVCVCLYVYIYIYTHTHTYMFSCNNYCQTSCKVFVPVYAPVASSVVVVFSRVWLCHRWTVAQQARLSMGFSRQEHWSGLPLLLQGTCPTQGSNPRLLHLLHWQVGSLPLSHLGSISNYEEFKSVSLSIFTNFNLTILAILVGV